MEQRRYIISGRVQGVGYRQFAYSAGRSLGISGFVRNLSNGQVECVAEGSDDQLSDLERALRSGPSYAEVASVIVSESKLKLSPGFRIV